MLLEKRINILLLVILGGILLVFQSILLHKFFQLELFFINSLFILLLLQRLYFYKQFLQPIYILILISLCLFSATRFFQVAQVNPYHTHELYHYVIGGKYFTYLGYEGLYAATAHVLVNQGIVKSDISVRDLSNKTNKYFTDWQAQAIQIQQAMPNDIWQTFVADIEFFSAQFGHSATTWRTMLHDHGFNPSPLWVLEASPILHSFPLPELYPKLIYFDYAIIIAIAFILLFFSKSWFWRWALLTAYWMILAYYPSVGWQSYIWIIGSFLRYSWFLYLLLGLFFLTRQQYFWAGITLALAGLERIFPLSFLGIAGLYLFIEFFKNYSANIQLKQFIKTPLFQFSLGSFVTLFICILLYGSFFEFSYFHQFTKNMSAHSRLLSDNSVGYKRLAIYTGTDTEYNIWQTQDKNINNFSEVTDKHVHDEYADKIYQTLYAQNWAARILQITLLLLFTLIIFNYMNLVSAVLFGGTALIYYLTSISYYYHVLFAIYAVGLILLVEQSNTKNNQFHLFLLLIFVASVNLLALKSTDFVQVSFSISLAQWFIYPLIAMAYVSPRLRAQILIFIISGISVWWIMTYNYQNIPASIPPDDEFTTLLRVDGQMLSTVMPDAPFTTHTYLDKKAMRIEDSGVTLFNGGEIYFSLSLQEKIQQPINIVIRSNFSYPVTLALYVNEQLVIEAQDVDKVGSFWGYAYLSIPTDTLQLGPNKIRLVLSKGEALGIYHIWAGYQSR